MNILVCGHSHVKDNYINRENKQYVNNGFALREKTFVYLNNGDLSFQDIR